MTWLSPRALRSTASALALLVAGQAAADQLERLERFKKQTVMITVTHREQSVSRGAGVVLCQEYGRAYVLTAYGLFAGEGSASGKNLRRPARTEIRFFGHRLPSLVDDRAELAEPGAAGPRRGVTLYRHGDFHGRSETFYEDDPNLQDNPIGNDTVSSLRIDPGCEVVLFEHRDFQGRSTVLSYKKARLWGTEVGRDNISSLKVSCQEIDETGLTFHQVPEEGLLLLSFPFQPLEWTAAARHRRIETVVSGFRRPIVSAVGYRGSSMESWAHESGRLFPGDDELLYHSAQIDQGFLGGPLFNKRWLIGINLRRVAGEEIGAEAGELYGEASPVRRILLAVGKWLPSTCRGWIGFRAGLFRSPAEGGIGALDPPGTTSPRPPAGSPQLVSTDVAAERAAATDTIAARRQPVAADWVPEEISLLQSLQQAISGRWLSEGLSADPERLKEQTVMITVTAEDRRVELGSGVVLCEEDRRAYVLTAHHVLAGKRPPARTEVQFFRQSVPSVVDDPTDGQTVITAHHLPEADLALLSIPVLGTPSSTASRVRPSAWARTQSRDVPDLLALGCRKSPMETWAMERGALLAGDGERLHHSAPIAEGFSGGPLFHGSGALIGINLRRISGEAIRAEAGVSYGEALPIEKILPLIRQWLPKRCLRTMEQAMGNALIGATDR